MRVSLRLLALLQKEFPMLGGQPIVWDFIKAAQGKNRTDPASQCYRWEASARFKVSKNAACNVGSYDTMMTCVKAGALTVSGNEVSANIETRNNDYGFGR